MDPLAASAPPKIKKKTGASSPKAAAAARPAAGAGAAAKRSRSWATCFNGQARRRAVLQGLDAIFALAANTENFRHFGNDTIQRAGRAAPVLAAECFGRKRFERTPVANAPPSVSVAGVSTTSRA